ncbi:MAG TPA: type II toxin-antitoxin system prevent-host-death family antitoxin [Chthoniobacterales bacterium]
MASEKITMAAGQFKARCLQLMDVVNEQGVEVTVTKHGRPVARLVPCTPKPLTPAELYGAMAGMATITGDLEVSLDGPWEADH